MARILKSAAILKVTGEREWRGGLGTRKLDGVAAPGMEGAGTVKTPPLINPTFPSGQFTVTFTV